MVSELIELRGHIIDSLILPKVLDEIMDEGATFEILHITIGKRNTDPSYAQVKLMASSRARLATLLKRLARLGATPVVAQDARLRRAPKDGVFPEGFYATTNLPTAVHWHGRWHPVRDIEMDVGIAVHRATGASRAVPMHRVHRGQWMVCGSQGVRVTPLERSRQKEIFQFMASAISSEKPKLRAIQELAQAMRTARRVRHKILFVVGPAVVHTGAAPYLQRLVAGGYVHVLFAGNGFATHDIESALFGTSLGIDVRRGVPALDGHEHHVRAINTIRSAGGIARAVRQGVLTRGVMHACVRHRVPYVLAGSIRDDGPLPEVMTDTVRAQDAMRRHVRGVEIAVMVASTLHAIATGNLLPATVKTVCVDINQAVVTKLSDRGSFQSLGLVTDSESFLRELCHALHV